MPVTRIQTQDIADGTITDTDIAAANKDGTAATPSLRTLGTGAQQAAAGNHGHPGATFVVGEVPDGAIDGTNDTFTLANTPVANTEAIYNNGLRLKQTVHYNISNNVITFTSGNIPQPGDILLADYQY
jgi:hypothetical protein